MTLLVSLALLVTMCVSDFVQLEFLCEGNITFGVFFSLVQSLKVSSPPLFPFSSKKTKYSL